MRDRKLCENCLSYTYFANCCKSPRGCSIEQCTITRKHLETLHDALPASFRRQEEKSSNAGPSVESGPSPLQKQSGHVVMKGDSSITETEMSAKPNLLCPLKSRVEGKTRS